MFSLLWLGLFPFPGPLLGNLCICCKRRSRPGRFPQRREGHSAKESRIHRKVVGHDGQGRPSPRGPRKPTRTAPSCPQRPSQPGSETRFCHGQDAESQSQGREMPRTTPPGGSIFESCPCRRRRGQLRVESSPGKCSPQVRTPPGGCSYAIVIRGHFGLNRYVKAAPSGCGGMRRRLEAQTKKARVGPYDNPRKTPREIAKLANPALVARLANSVHILQDAVKSGGDGSLEETQPGDPEPLRGLSPPPPRPNPAAPVTPLAPQNPPGGREPKETVKDTDTQSQHSAQMQD